MSKISKRTKKIMDKIEKSNKHFFFKPTKKKFALIAQGKTEDEAKKRFDVLVGRANYSDVAKGEAMMEFEGFAKAVVKKDDGRIVGFHIIGPYAPILIQEVINAMALGGKIGFIGQGMHIHPALSELILRTFSNLTEL